MTTGNRTRPGSRQVWLWTNTGAAYRRGRTPIASGYRPQFFVRTASVSGQVDLGEAATAMPGERLAVVVELGKPVALDRGLSFVIREGGKTAGAGTVTSVLG